MHSNKTILWILVGMLFAAATLVGCGAKGQPAEFEQTAGEMKEGPGLFTGDEGALVIFDSERGGAFPQLRGQKSEEGSKEDSKAADKETKASADKPSEKTRVAADTPPKKRDVSPEEAQEFKAFQEWKKEQQSFKEFQEWKKSEEGKAEYQEFLEWKEWKSYQEWKKQQNQ